MFFFLEFKALGGLLFNRPDITHQISIFYAQQFTHTQLIVRAVPCVPCSAVACPRYIRQLEVVSADASESEPFRSMVSQFKSCRSHASGRMTKQRKDAARSGNEA